jgi:hypothetical protein
VQVLSVNGAQWYRPMMALILLEGITGLCPVRDSVICPAGGFKGTIF